MDFFVLYCLGILQGLIVIAQNFLPVANGNSLYEMKDRVVITCWVGWDTWVWQGLQLDSGFSNKDKTTQW